MRVVHLALCAALWAGQAVVTFAEERVTADSIRVMIERGLPLGASRNDVEAFLSRQKLPFSFDRFQNRYQSIIRDVPHRASVDYAIVIYIYLDDVGGFSSAEVRDSFTRP
jgi:hypothetical protein